MVMFTARVPGRGFVDWTPRQIGAYARGLAEVHRSRRKWLLGQQQCAECGSQWPCDAALWASRIKRPPA